MHVQHRPVVEPASSDLSAAFDIKAALDACDSKWATGDRTGYAQSFLGAADAGAIDVILWIENDGPRLYFGLPLDDLYEARKARIENLTANLDADSQRKPALIAHMQRKGWFYDQRRFATAAEAVDAVLALDGRAFIIQGRAVETSLPTARACRGDDPEFSSATRSVVHRWRLSMMNPAFAAEVRAIVIARGKNLGGGNYDLMKGMA